MKIHECKIMAKGVGGSHTRWQGKPPAHAVFWLETDEGQTAVTAYDVRDRSDEMIVVDEGAVGPGDKPFKSEVDWSDLSEGVRMLAEARMVRGFAGDDFFDEPDSLRRVDE